jgi:hypothetical protein
MDREIVQDQLANYTKDCFDMTAFCAFGGFFDSDGTDAKQLDGLFCK